MQKSKIPWRVIWRSQFSIFRCILRNSCRKSSSILSRNSTIFLVIYLENLLKLSSIRDSAIHGRNPRRMSGFIFKIISISLRNFLKEETLEQFLKVSLEKFLVEILKKFWKKVLQEIITNPPWNLWRNYYWILEYVLYGNLGECPRETDGKITG